MKIVNDFLKSLDFSDTEIKVFETLSIHGPQTLLELSRNSGIERTRLYRLVDEIKQKGLVEEIPNYKKRTFKAADLATIKMLVKELKLKSIVLEDTFPAFLTALGTITTKVSKNNVIYYHGREGLRQMTWHILRTEGVFCTYSYRFWDEVLGAKFTESLNEEMVKLKVKVHDIYSDQYFKYKKEWLKKHGSKPGGNWGFWQSKYISEKILKIDQNIDIYNDTVAYYHWEGKETFGVEIHNERIAKFHKQMHAVIWKMAKPKPQLDWSKDW